MLITSALQRLILFYLSPCGLWLCIMFIQFTRKLGSQETTCRLILKPYPGSVGRGCVGPQQAQLVLGVSLPWLGNTLQLEYLSLVRKSWVEEGKLKTQVSFFLCLCGGWFLDLGVSCTEVAGLAAEMSQPPRNLWLPEVSRGIGGSRALCTFGCCCCYCCNNFKSKRGVQADTLDFIYDSS